MNSKGFFLPVLLIAALLAGCSGTPQSSGMDTPEKAVSAYVAAVAAGDFNAAIALCPADTMMKNFHADEYAKIENTSDKARSVDEIKSEYVQQTETFATSLLKSETAAPKAGTPITAAFITQFLKDNGTKLKDLQALRIDKPFKTGYNLEVDSDVYKQSTKDNRLVWGADDYTERIALIAHNGKTYLAGFTLVAYGGTWGISSVASTFAGLSGGGVQEMGQDEYLKQVKPSATASK